LIPADIISKKRDGQALSKNELNYFIKEYLSGSITNSQMSALLMAIYFKGMSDRETFVLLDVMLQSGSILNFENSKEYIADKHSTGGIGDKVSLILAPLMAAGGLKIPMIAGRGLGFTGGTVDKIESIPNINTNPSMEVFKDWIIKNRCAIVVQSNKIAPADKKIYSLRNLTGTVPSLPLICSSILSKKIAEGIQGLVMDIKIGNGAFLKTKKDAISLGRLITNIGTFYDIKTNIVFSSMDQPLGRFAGLACEVTEALECLNGNGPNDTMRITFELGSHLFLQAGIVNDKNAALKKMQALIDSKKALKYFKSMVNLQGGQLDDFKNITKPKYEQLVHSNKSGIINFMDTEKIGWALLDLGCGYKKPDDKLDYTAGIEFYKKVGDEVKYNDPLYRVFNSDLIRLEKVSHLLLDTFNIGNKGKPLELIL